MDELGSLLREAREAKGLTLTEVQEVIRVNPKYLKALEDGAYDQLPTLVHVRGYLRNYARFLNLDPEPILKRFLLNLNNYQVSSSTRSVEVTTDDYLLQSREDSVFFDPVNVELQEYLQLSKPT